MDAAFEPKDFNSKRQFYVLLGRCDKRVFCTHAPPTVYALVLLLDSNYERQAAGPFMVPQSFIQFSKSSAAIVYSTKCIWKHVDGWFLGFLQRGHPFRSNHTDVLSFCARATDFIFFGRLHFSGLHPRGDVRYVFSCSVVCVCWNQTWLL